MEAEKLLEYLRKLAFSCVESYGADPAAVVQRLLWLLDDQESTEWIKPAPYDEIDLLQP